MTTLRRVLLIYTLVMLGLWILPAFFAATIRPDEIGVRHSNFSGVLERDLEPGWVMRLPGAHKIVALPRGYRFLDYSAEENSEGQQLQIRTKDNNTVFLDVSVPYRVKPGEAWQLVRSGNHQRDADGRFKFERLAGETTISVLRERLAELSSADFYSTEKRLAIALPARDALNAKLAELHVEAELVLIRAVSFRENYETQLQQIQLNEQKKLLDEASKDVANEQQKLDNYVQDTEARARSLEQHWIERRSGLERAYQVGVIDVGQETEPGVARKRLEATTPEERLELVHRAATALEIPNPEQTESLGDAYLLGIRNIEAETLEYDRRVRAEADGIGARLTAEGAAMVAEVRGAYEGELNALLNSSAGRAYVAWKAAENVKFDETLTFQSSDGIPAILQLRMFAERFMGR